MSPQYLRIGPNQFSSIIKFLLSSIRWQKLFENVLDEMYAATDIDKLQIAANRFYAYLGGYHDIHRFEKCSCSKLTTELKWFFLNFILNVFVSARAYHINYKFNFALRWAVYDWFFPMIVRKSSGYNLQKLSIRKFHCNSQKALIGWMCIRKANWIDFVSSLLAGKY